MAKISMGLQTTKPLLPSHSGCHHQEETICVALQHVVPGMRSVDED